MPILFDKISFKNKSTNLNSLSKFNQKLSKMSNFNYLIFLILILINSAQSVKQPRLEIAPRMAKINLPEGERSLLTCSGADQEPTFFTNLKWIDPKGLEINKNNEFYGTNYNTRTKQGGILLSFTNPSENLSGNYTCKGLFQNVFELSESIEVAFFQDITWQDCPTTQALIKGKSNSLIRCKVTAKPPAELSWSKDRKDLSSSKFLRSNDGLIINGIVDDTLEGKYEIEAHVSETGRIAYNSIVVNVYTMPEILELQNSHEVVEDEEARLNCKATGIPPPRYYWLDPNKRNLSSVGGYIVDTDNGQLIINKVNKEDAKGEFTCLVENSAGSTSRTTKVDVLSKPKIVSFFNTTSVQGSNGNLNCIASGNPAPEMSIRKDGASNTITSGGNYNIEEIKLNEFETKLVMNIFGVQRNDDGLYYCIATNKIGKIDQVGHLQVEFKPDLSKTPKLVKTWADREINLTCIVESIPNATISWYHKNERISDGIFYKIINEDVLDNFKRGLTGLNYLKINPRSSTSSIIYGDYVCRAENKHGYDYATINLSQAHRPSIQEDPDLTNDSPNSILIKFNNNNMNNGGLPIKKMKVRYRERSEPEHMARIEEFPFDNDYILKGLIPRSFYYLSFAVENDVGTSDWTREYEKIMPRESVPDCPKFTYDQHASGCVLSNRPIEGNLPDRFDVKWLQPNDNGRPIEFYVLRYYPVVRVLVEWNRIGDYKELFSSSNDQLVQHLTALKPNTTYEVELRAKNSEGYSPSSRFVFRTSLSNDIGPFTFQEQISKAFTDFHFMIIIVLISIVVALIILDIILYSRYDFGFLFCICHGCSSTETRTVKKIKNSHSLNTAYSYHRPSAEIDPIMDSQKAEFKAELEYRLRMPKQTVI